ncbi:MAG: ABC transporter permease subunit [Alphaproteobacteria bacterium]|jgi:putative spermidine/putrescine transport system permease protein|nr:ABC transporter permease subunit [Alphaproteobacteria bacterium]
MTRTRLKLILLGPALLFLGAFFVAPVAGFVAQGATPDQLNRLAMAGAYLRVLGNSFVIAGWVTLATLAVGYPVAYVLATMDRRRRGYWSLFVLLPFWSSFLVRSFAWIVLLGRNGPLNDLLVSTGLADRPQELLYGPAAVVIGMTNVLTPFAILTMLGVLEGIAPELSRAAGTLGARPVQAFFRIYLPLSFPGIAAAGLLVFVTAFGFFIAPALLGSVRETMIAQLVIQQVLELTNWPFAAMLCLALLVAALAVFLLYDRIVGLSSLAGGTGARRDGGRIGRAGSRILAMVGDGLARVAPSRPRPPGRAPATRAAALLVIFFLLAPLILLVPVSFSGQSFVSWPPTDPTLRWYGEVVASPIWLAAAGRSFFVAFLTALGCFAVAMPAGVAFMMMSGRSAAALFALIVSPLIVPRLVIAVSLFYVYARLGWVGTTLGLVIGHIVIALPFFFIAVLAVLKTYDTRLDQAAASLGAPPWTAARRVTLPLIGTGLVSASLFAFVTSLDELNVALFASGGLVSTLPKMMWDEATLRFSPVLAAVSTLVLLVMSAVVLLALRLGSSVKES